MDANTTGEDEYIRPIKLLPETTVNRIAAGEIIQRPANALKELIENSLDGNATTIKISVRDGGIKSLSVIDNGSGIRKDDMPILCQRHTTSKIEHFDDLSAISTFGFRGEALASISHVAHLTVLTKTSKDASGWKAMYSDGILIPTKPGDQPVARPAAANNGTTINIQDLFYNTPQRRKALRPPSEEYARVYDVVARYAIHNSGKSFVLKKSDNATPDISTPQKATVLDNIGIIFSDFVRRELLEFESHSDSLGFKATGYISNPNYSSKKPTFILFINHRLVDCTSLRKAIDTFYASLLPKGSHPFIYLDLQIEPARVDVNVHPTKREVQFLEEDDIVGVICDSIEQRLSNANQSKTFLVQTLLPGAASSSSSSAKNPFSSYTTKPTESSSSSYKTPAYKLVRTDHNARTLDGMFGLQTRATRANEQRDSQLSENNDSQILLNEGDEVMEEDEEDEEEEEEDQEEEGQARDSNIGLSKKPLIKKHTYSQESNSGSQVATFNESQSFSSSSSSDLREPMVYTQKSSQLTQRRKIPTVTCFLDSVNELKKNITVQNHKDIEKIIKNHTFVAIVDLSYNLSLIQHMTKLYLVNHAAFAEQLFYQLGLRQFGGFSKLKLQPPPKIYDLVTLAVDIAPSVENAPLSKHQIIDKVCQILISHREMLSTYFSLSIDESGLLSTLPLLLADYIPNLDKLPMFILRLGVEVDWTEEKACFDTFLKELAFLYSPTLLPGESQTNGDSDQDSIDNLKWTIRHVLFPVMKQVLEPPSFLSDKDINQIASLEALYRVFERC